MIVGRYVSGAETDTDCQKAGCGIWSAIVDTNVFCKKGYESLYACSVELFWRNGWAVGVDATGILSTVNYYGSKPQGLEP